MMTLEEVWENLRQNPETKATMEEAEKSYKLFKKIENLIVSDLETKLAKGVEIIDEWMQLNFEKSVKINQLEHQLEDKEKEIEELKKGVYKVTLGTTPSNQIDFTENFYIIQNQTAIDKLEKVKELLKHKGFVLKVKPPIELPTVKSQEYLNQFNIFVEDFDRIFDQQIKELKGDADEKI